MTPGEAHDSETQLGQDHVALAIILERFARPVVLPTIGLDHEALTRPEEVDDEAVDWNVALWWWKAGSSREGEHPSFEFLAGHGTLVELVKAGSQALGSGSASVHVPFELARVEDPQPGGLSQHAVDAVLVQQCGFVGDGAHRGRHRDAADGRDVPRFQGARVVQDDPWLRSPSA